MMQNICRIAGQRLQEKELGLGTQSDKVLRNVDHIRVSVLGFEFLQ